MNNIEIIIDGAKLFGHFRSSRQVEGDIENLTLLAV